MLGVGGVCGEKVGKWFLGAGIRPELGCRGGELAKKNLDLDSFERRRYIHCEKGNTRWGKNDVVGLLRQGGGTKRAKGFLIPHEKSKNDRIEKMPFRGNSRDRDWGKTVLSFGGSKKVPILWWRGKGRQ